MIQQVKAHFSDFISRIIITTSNDIQEYRVTVNGDPLTVTIELKIKNEINRHSIETQIKKMITDLLERNNVEVNSIAFRPYTPQAKYEKKRRIFFSPTTLSGSKGEVGKNSF